ncbi:MAG TPA: SNF2-related protein, partial [Candidatus Angelobacter sp.]|nr:SNF2-related protein [Candidatus Angelobacter sp.]
IPDSSDREIVAMLAGSGHYYGYGDSYERMPDSFQVEPILARKLMPLIAGTGRCHLGLEREVQVSQLAWDDTGSWSFALEVLRSADGGYQLDGTFRRGEERMQVNEPLLIFKGGLLFTRDCIAPWQEEIAFEWISHFRSTGSIKVPEGQQERLLASMLASRRLPALDLPEELRPEEVTGQPRACLRISTPAHCRKHELQGELSFDYGVFTVPADDPSRGVYDGGSRRFFHRDFAAEDGARTALEELGIKPERVYWNLHPVYRLRRTKLPRLVPTLVQAGWHVEAEGKIFRRPGISQLSVSSGVDWFELRGEVDYGECTANLPALLEAVRRGDKMVHLDDGTYGMLPEEWLRRIAPLAAMGAAENGHIRFHPSQAGLLDALLATQPEARCDEVFDRLRGELASFSGVQAAAQPQGFCGQLRNYQAEGLGWLQFLERFSFGGCLADDMGLGKTAQVLALLEMRREARAAGEAQPPSLVVVPRSLVFNWKQEASRFAPALRVLDYTGIARSRSEFSGYDVVLTTYGTVRRDAVRLKDTEFDYVVLDEAQAVKNAGTDSSKAVRLLRARRRLALSGTPVENHLGELWTLFEFLNPGMLGAASALQLAGGTMRNPTEETRRLLAHALRPFILRRTKQQVARELPAKTEQTIFCEMEPGQRKLYAELRQHYRNSLLAQVERAGMAKSKIHVLEALLRLRQAACHPGLLDKKRAHEPSAKLDVLLEQLREVLGEGHKALVFSQFTSLLAILRRRLEDEGVKYEYLDGKIRDRQARVDSFQKDPACGLFLISLKAGGLGLNLTAAEYVFILDPWWNPAVEAQAVDRAHRIGQTRQVFAYRLITRDTVEEKVLELQRSKRDLADAIIGEKNSLIRDLRSEDLELLLS